MTRECFANLGHKMWALLASYREGLRAVKWMRNREYLEYIQRYRLRMLARSLESVPYYRDIMRQRGIEADAIQSRCDIELFPLLTRRIIRSEFRSLISKGPLHCHLEHSSGSTGEPIAVLVDQRRRALKSGAVIARKLITGRSLWWERIAICCVRQARYLIQRGKHFSYRQGLAQCRVFCVDEPSCVDELTAWNPSVVSGWPSCLRGIALTLIDRNCPLRVATVISHSELLDEQTERLLKDAFGGTVINEYGTNETGDIAATCCSAGGLHVDDGNVIVEIVDREGRCVPNGEVGRVAVTVLENYSMPLVRYVTEDYASMRRGPCTCGLASGVIEEIVGREHDVLIGGTGERIYPMSVYQLLHQASGFRKWRVIQHTSHRVIVEYVAANANPESTLRWLSAELKQLLGSECNIVYHQRNEIPALPGGKLQTVIRASGGATDDTHGDRS